MLMNSDVLLGQFKEGILCLIRGPNTHSYNWLQSGLTILGCFINIYCRIWVRSCFVVRASKLVDSAVLTQLSQEIPKHKD